MHYITFGYKTQLAITQSPLPTVGSNVLRDVICHLRLAVSPAKRWRSLVLLLLLMLSLTIIHSQPLLVDIDIIINHNIINRKQPVLITIVSWPFGHYQSLLAIAKPLLATIDQHDLTIATDTIWFMVLGRCLVVGCCWDGAMDGLSNSAEPGNTDH